MTEQASVPNFNPTNVPEDELYARGARLNPDKDFGWKPHSDFEPEAEAVDIYRIEERKRVASGVGLIASRAAVEGSLGDVGDFSLVKHISSSHTKRVESQTTPFVSFSADPEHLAKKLILRRGFGVKGGRDSVVVKARVHPSRILSGGGDKQEVLLVGGLAQDEYETTHEIGDFVADQVKPDEEVEVAKHGSMKPKDALKLWQEEQPQKLAA